MDWKGMGQGEINEFNRRIITSQPSIRWAVNRALDAGAGQTEKSFLIFTPIITIQIVREEIKMNSLEWLIEEKEKECFNGNDPTNCWKTEFIRFFVSFE